VISELVREEENSSSQLLSRERGRAASVDGCAMIEFLGVRALVLMGARECVEPQTETAAIMRMSGELR
jgi:hypothetical protein